MKDIVRNRRRPCIILFQLSHLLRCSIVILKASFDLFCLSLPITRSLLSCYKIEDIDFCLVT